MLGFQNIKNFLVKDILLIVQKFLLYAKLIKLIPWTYVFSDLNGENVVATFDEKELQKTNQKEFGIEKIIKRKGNQLYFKWKAMISFNSCIDKKDIV